MFTYLCRTLLADVWAALFISFYGHGRCAFDWLADGLDCDRPVQAPHGYKKIFFRILVFFSFYLF